MILMTCYRYYLMLNLNFLEFTIINDGLNIGMSDFQIKNLPGLHDR